MPRDNINQRVVPVKEPLRAGAMTKMTGEMTKNGSSSKIGVNTIPTNFNKAKMGTNVSTIGTDSANKSDPEEKAEFKKYGFDNDTSTEGKEVSQGMMSKGSQAMDKPVEKLVMTAAKSRAGISFKQNVRK